MGVEYLLSVSVGALCCVTFSLLQMSSTRLQGMEKPFRCRQPRRDQAGLVSTGYGDVIFFPFVFSLSYGDNALYALGIPPWLVGRDPCGRACRGLVKGRWGWRLGAICSWRPAAGEPEWSRDETDLVSVWAYLAGLDG